MARSVIPAASAAPSEVPAVPPRRIWPLHLLVLGLYSALSLFYLAPLLEHFWENVPFGGDTWLFYWDLWWVNKALVDLHTNPFYTTFVNYPGGASLNFHTLAFLDGVLAIPLQWLGMSLAGAYNTFVFFGYIFSAYAVFCLADYLVGNKLAAFVAGLIFGFSPLHFAHLIGHLNFVTIQWLPFYVLFMLKAFEEGQSRRTKWTNIGLAALFLSLNALTEWTLAAFLVLFSLLYVLYQLGLRWREWKVVLLGPIWRLGLILIFFGVLTSPVLIPMLNELRSNQNVKYDPDQSIMYSADLMSFVTPYEYHPVLSRFSQKRAQEFTGNAAERTTYLGFVALVLGIYGAWFYRRRGTGFWVLSFFSFGILALGPLLHYNGRMVFTVFKLNVPLPYAFFYNLPFFSIMRTPGRFALIVIFSLSILAAFGMKALLVRLPRLSLTRKRPKLLPGLRWAVVGLVSFLIIFEFAPYIGSAYPNVPPLYDPIRHDPDPNVAVLELPLRPASHFYIAQVVYGKPMIGGYLARQVDNPLIDQTPALKTLALRSEQPTGNADQLKAVNVRYVIVNWWMLDEGDKTKMRAALQTVFGRPPDAEENEPDGSKVRLSLYILK